MENKKILVLDDSQIRSTLVRIAWQIIEETISENEVTLLGIGKKGGELLGFIEEVIQANSDLKTSKIDSEKIGGGKVLLLNEKNDLTVPEVGTLVIIDDVLYSGFTMFNAISEAMKLKPKRVLSVVLIDRGHRMISIHPDFYGLKLATTLQQRVEVEISMSSKEMNAFLL